MGSVFDTFCDTRVCIVSGKGGVGKTTVSAVLAATAARFGKRVLLVEVEGKSGLAAAFDAKPFGYEPETLAPGIEGRTITAEQALLEFLDDHNLHWVAKRLQSMNLLEVVATAAPGIKDILVLGKVKQIDNRRDYDLIIVDAPAAGHTLTFLGSAAGIVDAVRVGPVLTQANEVQEMLTDRDRTSVVLVTLPEETPVNETVETADALVGLRIDVSGVVVNGWYPEGPAVELSEVHELAARTGTVIPEDEAVALAEASRFRAMRHSLQRRQMDRLEDLLALPFVRLPFLFTASIGPAEIEALADLLSEDHLEGTGV